MSYRLPAVRPFLIMVSLALFIGTGLRNAWETRSSKTAFTLGPMAAVEMHADYGAGRPDARDHRIARAKNTVVTLEYWMRALPALLSMLLLGSGIILLLWRGPDRPSVWEWLGWSWLAGTGVGTMLLGLLGFWLHGAAL